MKKQITLLIAMLLVSCLPSYGQLDNMATPPESAPVVIYGEIKSNMPVEELTLTVQTHYLTPNGKFPSPIKVNTKTESGNLFTGTLGFETFHFSSEPIDEIAVISIFHTRGVLIQDYKVIPGDTVRINADFTTLRTSFSGPAAKSFIFQSHVKIINASNDLNQPNAIVTPNADGLIERFSEAFQTAKDDPVRPVMTILDSKQATLKYLKEWVSTLPIIIEADECSQNFEGQVDEKILHAVLADRLGLERYKILDHFNRIYDGSDAHNAFYHQFLKDLDSNSLIESSIMASPRYMDFLVKSAIVNARVNGGRAIDHMQSHTPLLRDRLKTKYIADNLKRLPDSEALLNRVMYSVDDPWALKTLQELYLSQHAGEEFLDVELENEKGERIHISSFKGKVLVLDFWITGCRACAGLFQSTLKPLQEQFKKGGNVEFISISADQNREMWLKSLQSGKYTDANAQNLRIPTRDNPLLSKYKIQSYPSLLLIDEDGNLLKSTGIPTEKEALSNVIKEAIEN